MEVFTYDSHILLSTPFTACQSLSACMIARSSVHAYILETVVGRSEMQMLRPLVSQNYILDVL